MMILFKGSNIVRTLLALMAGLLTFTALRASGEKPNIIVIVTDDMGYADLGVLGNVDDIKTPHLDQLARDDVLCKAGYVTAPQPRRAWGC